MRVLLHYSAGRLLRDQLVALDDLDVSICPEADEELFRVLLRDADVLWHVLKPVTASHLGVARRLRLIQKIGVGVNTIDLDTAREQGIAVCNLPGTNSRAVAEMTLALILATLRRLPFYDRATRQGDGWALDPSVQDRLGELAGRTVGLVGLGAVPQVLAPILLALGARVLYTARRRRQHCDAEWRELPELLAESDVVSLHVPATPDTERLIDAQAIARMKAGAILVNTARGQLVDEDALVAALRSGQLSGAALDVFASEPADPANPLLRLDNVVLAPHVAWLTPETFERSLVLARENCRRLASGEPLLHRVL